MVDVRAAPVVDLGTREYLAMLTASDALDMLLAGRGGPGDMNTVGSMSTASNPASTPMGNLRCANSTESLLAACIAMRDDGLHRVPIVAGRSLLCVLDYGRVLRFVHGHLASTATDDESGNSSGGGGGGTGISGGGGDDRQIGTRRLFSLTIEQLALGNYSDIITMRETDKLIDVLRTLQARNLRAVPIINADGKLTNVYSRSDAALLAGGDWGPSILEGCVADMLKRVRDVDFIVVTCRRSDCLGEVFRRFEISRRHRLYIVDDSGIVIGVLCLSDLLRYFLEGY